ncbi:hypothetical protein D1872_311470 [compost metagenome]
MPFSTFFSAFFGSAAAKRRRCSSRLPGDLSGKRFNDIVTSATPCFFLTVRIKPLHLSAIGPDSPKWVKIISPR